MLSKIKKIFFVGMFGALYISFVAQFIYVLTMLFSGSIDTGFMALGMLSIQWLALIAARYLSKKSAGGREIYQGGGYHHNRR
ncbi:MAG: hypothetical protein FWG80_01880 [Alphaproteobacteria bacterium]|nr:hypothetical protein [Alphaproteobacteria bacterium]